MVSFQHSLCGCRLCHRKNEKHIIYAECDTGVILEKLLEHNLEQLIICRFGGVRVQTYFCLISWEACGVSPVPLES